MIVRRGGYYYSGDERGTSTQMLINIHRRLAYEHKRRKALKYRPEYDMKVVGANLKRLREAKHLTVEQVREYLMLGSVQAVYKYEKGKSYPQTDTMFALMELYGATLSDITCRHDEVPVRTNEEGREPSSFFSFFAGRRGA